MGTGKNAADPVLQLVAPVVRDDKGLEITRTMRTTGTLQGLMDFYYTIVTTVPRGAGVFLYRGKRLDGKKTPAYCKMKSGGDPIEFLSEMKPSMFVTLTVQDCERRRLTRTMRRSEKLQVLMDFYFASVPIVAYKNGSFLFDGEHVKGSQTPGDLCMEDGDEIDYFPSVF